MTLVFTWSRYGGYECSSQGDSRFSALNARLKNGRTIEAHYQCDVKGYNPGGTNWKLGKGKPPLTLPLDQLWPAYLALWQTWATENKPLMGELRILATDTRGILSDRFAKSSINQARALAECLNSGF